MHHEVQIKKKEKYHYLAQNARIGKNKWKRFRIYIGKGSLSKKEIEKLVSKNRTKLKVKIDSELRKHNPLLSLLSVKKIKELEEVKKNYKQSMKNISKTLWQKNYETFITQFTYDTNAIEGSTVTLRETGMILFDKIVPKGKKIREIREVENHKKVFDFVIGYKGEMNKRFVLKVHKKLMHNILWGYAGKFRDVQVYIRGVEKIPPPPEEVENEFKILMKWYASNKKKYHPVIIAAYFHAAFESIHPFVDGNGRVGRLLLNFILRKNGFPLIDIKFKDREDYYRSLQAVDKGDLQPLVSLTTKYLLGIKIHI